MLIYVLHHATQSHVLFFSLPFLWFLSFFLPPLPGRAVLHPTARSAHPSSSVRFGGAEAGRSSAPRLALEWLEKAFWLRERRPPPIVSPLGPRRHFKGGQFSFGWGRAARRGFLRQDKRNVHEASDSSIYLTRSWNVSQRLRFASPDPPWSLKLPRATPEKGEYEGQVSPHSTQWGQPPRGTLPPLSSRHSKTAIQRDAPPQGGPQGLAGNWKLHPLREKLERSRGTARADGIFTHREASTARRLARPSGKARWECPRCVWAPGPADALRQRGRRPRWDVIHTAPAVHTPPTGRKGRWGARANEKSGPVALNVCSLSGAA